MAAQVRNTDSYDVLLFKIISPVVVVGLLWTYPLWHYIKRQSHHEAWQTAARLSLLFIELVLPMVATFISRIFLCRSFDDGAYMQMELTLACDDSARRRGWVAIASVALVAYPLGTCESLVLHIWAMGFLSSQRSIAGVPLAFYCLLFRRQADIQILGQKLDHEGERSGIMTYASDLSKTKHMTLSVAKLQRRPSVVGHFQSLKYLVHQFEKFRPTHWYMGVCLLLLRLFQTCLMTVIKSQLAQAATMGCITLCAAFLQNNLSPYRRQTDNHVALLIHW